MISQHQAAQRSFDRSDIKKRIEESNKKLAQLNARFKKLDNQADYQNIDCMDNLIKSQQEILDALNNKNNQILCCDENDTLLNQHIEKSLYFAEELANLLVNTPPKLRRSEIITYDIKQLTYANYQLHNAIKSPEYDVQMRDEYPDRRQMKNDRENGQAHTNYLESSIKSRREHLTLRDQLRLHLKKNILLSTLIAASVTAIALAATVPVLAPVALAIFFGAGFTLVAVLVYKVVRDVHPLTPARVDEEKKKDVLYNIHNNIFKHKDAARGFNIIRKAEVINAREKEAKPLRQASY